MTRRRPSGPDGQFSRVTRPRRRPVPIRSRTAAPLRVAGFAGSRSRAGDATWIPRRSAVPWRRFAQVRHRQLHVLPRVLGVVFDSYRACGYAGFGQPPRELAPFDAAVVPVYAAGRDDQRREPACYRPAATRTGALWLVPNSTNADGSPSGGGASMSHAGGSTRRPAQVVSPSSVTGVPFGAGGCRKRQPGAGVGVPGSEIRDARGSGRLCRRATDRASGRARCWPHERPRSQRWWPGRGRLVDFAEPGRGKREDQQRPRVVGRLVSGLTACGL